MIEKTIVSQSELATYKRCKRKWWLQYYRGLQKKTEKWGGAPAHIGTRVHGALEMLYMKTGDPVEFVRDAYDQDIEQRQNDPFEADQLVKDKELASAMVEGYVQWVEEEGIDQGFEFLGAEVVVVTTLSEEDNIDIVGKLDQRVRKTLDGSRWFVDYKTVGNFTDILSTSHINEQFQHYMLLERLAQSNGDVEHAERTEGGIWRMIRRVKRGVRAKPPFFREESVRYNEQTLNSYWLRVFGMTKDIQDTRAKLDDGQDHHIVAYPTPTKNCSWDCPFVNVCHLFDDGTDVDDFLQDEYRVGDPYKRYDGVEVNAAG